MADIVEMIQLSPTMEEGQLVSWLKKEGDEVATGDLIAEVETDKATMEMESFFDGVILKILAKEGTAAPVGQALAIIGEEGEDISDLLEEIEQRGSGGGAKAEAATDGGGANGADDAKADDAKADDAPVETTPAPSGGRGDGRILSSPLARRIAEDRGIDLRDVEGSGPGGRIVRRDVESFEPKAAAAPAQARPSAPARVEARGEDQRVDLSPMRKSIAKNLSAAWQAPAFMLTRTIDMDRAMAIRAQINADLAARETGVKISVNDLVIKACARALIDVPEMNSAYQGDHIILFGSADIGVAVALDGGLITPIIRSADQKPLSTIATEARELAGRARQKKLAPDEYTGATFSISNLGMFGIDHFTAVLNPPAAGILAVGQVAKVPVVNDAGALVVGQRMTVTLTCDHRAVDGAVGARFLQRFAAYMELPALMLV